MVGLVVGVLPAGWVAGVVALAVFAALARLAAPLWTLNRRRGRHPYV